jgi:Ca2+-binding RTX toxin-like protein
LIGGSGTDLFVLADGAFGSFSSTSSTPNRILDFGKADQLAVNVPGIQRSDFTIVDSAAGAIIRIAESWSSRLGTSDLAILQGVKANAIQESQILINQSQAAIATSTLSRVDVLDQAV